MDRLRCPECEKTFRTEAGLNWHLQRTHSKSAIDNQSKPAAMAQEVSRRPEPPLVESPATPTEAAQPREAEREVKRYYVIA